jgi:cysteine synthase
MEHLKKLKREGITVVGYVETAISQAGWGVAWACKELEMTAVIYDPQYKDDYPELLDYHRAQWKKFDATIIPIKAGMAKVNWYICKKNLKEIYGEKAVMLPLGLPFDETIDATRREVIDTWDAMEVKPNNIVCCVGSGTIIAGIWQGLNEIKADCDLYGIMTRTGNVEHKLNLIEHKAKLHNNGIMKSSVKFALVDPGWEYTDKLEIDCPFPCHPYYDLKAWQWLQLHINILNYPVLFWNIGH